MGAWSPSWKHSNPSCRAASAHCSSRELILATTRHLHAEDSIVDRPDLLGRSFAEFDCDDFAGPEATKQSVSPIDIQADAYTDVTLDLSCPIVWVKSPSSGHTTRRGGAVDLCHRLAVLERAGFDAGASIMSIIRPMDSASIKRLPLGIS